MIRRALVTLTIALVSRTVAAQEMSVEQFLGGPALGDVQTTTEVKGETSTQATAGKHKGHRVLKATIPLCEKSEPPYTISYNACLEIDKHPGAVDLIAREGLSGVGLSRPTGANWYSGGCIDVVINGKGLGAYRPRMERVVHVDGAVTARATWRVHGGKVVLSFTQMLDGECCYVKGVIDCPEVRSLVVKLRCYPSGYAEPRERAAWTASASQVGPGTLLVPSKDFWVLYGDDVHDRAKDKRGQGTCAVMFAPTQVQGARVKVTGYAVGTDIALRPETKAIHLILWEFPKRTNEEALAHMREIGGELRTGIGRPAVAAVQMEGVPDRTIVLDGRPASTICLRKDAQDREI